MPSMLICQCPNCSHVQPAVFPGAPLKEAFILCEECGEEFNAWDNAKERSEENV